MTSGAQRTQRRSQALSKEKIVEAAVGILDRDGEDGLTFRALAARLATGSGAIYWHVADKNELLAAAADEVMAGVMVGGAESADPREAIRTFALGVFDAIDVHPWVGAQIFREPWRPVTLGMFERIGRWVQALGAPEHSLFGCASALANYILGVAAQNAANARLHVAGTDRSAFLSMVAERWTEHDPAQFPFVHRIAAKMRDHDDREQFLAGIDLLLAGIGTIR
ncbi:TetR/AcrR family transcriptional regulator [Kaistia algarum]|uniref:TetR/AcrR family transcriptional regulator n=1 Tax=Kaistia algarum TaxID=2083279 RepID=UPI002256F222|nr:TetR family transcriptional regulator [Kaistia algarum]MCX5515888.1 TetR family transcriptional regulator [Kaistia algarum]